MRKVGGWKKRRTVTDKKVATRAGQNNKLCSVQRAETTKRTAHACIARLMDRWRMERAEKRGTSRLVTGGDALFLQGSTNEDRWTGSWMIRTKALQGSREGDSQRTKDSSTHEFMQCGRPGTWMSHARRGIHDRAGAMRREAGCRSRLGIRISSRGAHTRGVGAWTNTTGPRDLGDG